MKLEFEKIKRQSKKLLQKTAEEAKSINLSRLKNAGENISDKATDLSAKAVQELEHSKELLKKATDEAKSIGLSGLKDAGENISDRAMDVKAKAAQEFEHYQDKRRVIKDEKIRLKKIKQQRRREAIDRFMKKAYWVFLGGLVLTGLAFYSSPSSFFNAFSGRDQSEATEQSDSACVRRGIQYYKDIGSYPQLSTGEDVKSKVRGMCHRSKNQAFKH